MHETPGGDSPRAEESHGANDDGSAEEPRASRRDRVVARCVVACERLAPCPLEEGVEAEECADTCALQGELVARAGCLPTWEEGIRCAEEAERCEPELCEDLLRLVMDCAIDYCIDQQNDEACGILQ
ncbi:MAG: hypothetical protein AAGF12_01415 [Myxococcota bacterium]